MKENFEETISEIFELVIENKPDVDLSEAKLIYENLAGKIDCDCEYYDMRLNLFHDWYLFDYIYNQKRAFLQNVLISNGYDEDFMDLFSSCQFSLFEFYKTTFKNKVVIKDLYQQIKYTLENSKENIGVINNDIFLGRVVTLKDRFYLLRGVCHFPNDVFSIVKKPMKNSRNKKEDESKEAFIYKLEFLFSKWLRFGKPLPSKIFLFD